MYAVLLVRPSKQGGIEIEESIHKQQRNARAELDQSNSLGLSADCLLVNDDVETRYEIEGSQPNSLVA